MNLVYFKIALSLTAQQVLSTWQQLCNGITQQLIIDPSLTIWSLSNHVLSILFNLEETKEKKHGLGG